MIRVALYARFSSDMQKESSIVDQCRNCDNYVKRQEGWQVTARYADRAISGATAERPDYQRMLVDAKVGQFDVLIVDDLSRLSRDVVEVETARRRLVHWGVRIIGVSDGVDTNSKGHRMLVSVRGILNDVFLEDLAAKVKRGMVGQVLQGYHGGGRCYGYRLVPDLDPTKKDPYGQPLRIGTRLEIDPEQAKWVRWIFTQYSLGMAPRAIVEELNRRGVPPPGLAYRRRSTTAPSWCGSALTGNAKYGLGLLNCRLYQGELVWGRSRWSKDPDTKRKRRTLCPEHEWITRSVPHLRIIDDELWEKVRTRQQAVHDASAAIRAALRANARTGRGPKYLFSGLLTCGLCGHKFIVVDPLQYACSGWKYRGACANTVKVARKVVEALLLEAIQHELFTEEGLARFEQQVAKRLREHQQARKPERAQAEQYLQQVEREIENIMTAIKAGVVTPTTKAELEKAEATRAALLRTIKGHEATGSKVTAILPDMIGRFRTMVENLVTVTQPQVDKARASLRMLLGKEIVLHPSADGAERYLTAEVSGNYAGLVQLVTGKNKFGGGDATLPKLTEALSFRIHAIAFVA